MYVGPLTPVVACSPTVDEIESRSGVVGQDVFRRTAFRVVLSVFGETRLLPEGVADSQLRCWVGQLFGENFGWRGKGGVVGSGRMFMYKGVGWGAESRARTSCVGCVGWMRGEKPQVPGQVSTTSDPGRSQFPVPVQSHRSSRRTRQGSRVEVFGGGGGCGGLGAGVSGLKKGTDPKYRGTAQQYQRSVINQPAAMESFHEAGQTPLSSATTDDHGLIPHCLHLVP